MSEAPPQDAATPEIKSKIENHKFLKWLAMRSLQRDHKACRPCFAKGFAGHASLATQVASEAWWACLESNQGPRPYQGRALTN